MSFTLVWPSGLTDDLSTVDAAQLMKLDSDHVAAIDGVGGGTYAPSTKIVVGGEGIDHQYIADIAALKAVNTTSLPDGSIRFVTGYGRFVLAKAGAPATDAEDLPVVVQPTTGTGRWFAQDPIAKRQWTKTINASGSFTLPRNITLFEYDMCGGGGGGGGGSGADTSASDTVGGGGGGGAKRVRGLLAGVFGTWSAIVGSAGAGGAANSNGHDGGSSALLDPSVTIVAYGWGGGGGTGGTIAVADAGSLRLGVAPGGRCVAEGLTSMIAPCFSSVDPILPVMNQDSQQGGFGCNSQVAGVFRSPDGAADGANSPDGGSGGSAGTRGTNTGGHLGGGASGGGGAGPYNGSTGGAGGNGGNGVAVGAGNNGNPGSAPPAGSYGGGGGGGGGAGQGSVGGGLGGAGGPGLIGVIFLRGVQ